MPPANGGKGVTFEKHNGHVDNPTAKGEQTKIVPLLEFGYVMNLTADGENSFITLPLRCHHVAELKQISAPKFFC